MNKCFLIKFGLISTLCASLITGCGTPKPYFDSETIAPLITAKYKLEGSVATFKSIAEKEPGKIITYDQTDCSASPATSKETKGNQYLEGRRLYNDAASDINSLLKQTILSIRTYNKVAESKAYKEQVATAICESKAFKEFFQQFEEDHNKDNKGIPFLSFSPVGLPEAITAITGAIKAFQEEARLADIDRRTKIAEELKTLLLPSFDEIRVPSPSSSPETSPSP